MKSKAVCILVVILIAAFAASFGLAADEAKIVVMNPRGIQPEIRKIPMAARPATLDGKTVYIVDTKYPNTKPFVGELFDALKAKYPKTTWVLREKFAGYMDDDPNLWKEIKAKGAGAIVLVGH
jgi:ABC-type branched-subunit amino acid transport system substrate-binding protein